FALLLLLYGTLVRFNALPGAVPLYFYWAWVVFAPIKRMLAIPAFVTLCLLGAFGNKIIESVVTVGSNHPQNKLYLHDLTGIFVLTDDNVFPAMSYTEPTFDTVYLKQHYHPATYDNIFWNKDGKMKWNYLDAEYTYAIRDAWLAAVKKHPGAYFSHRLQSFLYFLKIRNRPAKYYFAFAWIHKNPYGFTLQRNWLWYVFVYPILAQGVMFYMKPWFWLLLSSLLLSRTSKLKHPILRTPFVVLLVSALLYILPQFFISQTDTEFRYVYWSCIACSLALLIYIFRNRLQPLP
ncbi:MAG: hypothetical protein K0R82_961, partial [Flavipsychrobacter sp.]|nr:hypothetical protein [Flavipsychrobacter sp.]